MTAPALIKEADLARILKAARKAEYPRVRVTIDPAGNIVVDVSDEAPLPAIRANPLDRLLDR